jgi:hypothetical protein
MVEVIDAQDKVAEVVATKGECLRRQRVFV